MLMPHHLTLRSTGRIDSSLDLGGEPPGAPVTSIVRRLRAWHPFAGL